MKLNVKPKIVAIILFFISIILIPIVAVGRKEGKSLKETLRRSDIKTCSMKHNSLKDRYFVLFDEFEEKTIKVSDIDFMYGALATEMPPTFHREALKAQAVAMYTYFSRNRLIFRNKNGELCDKPEFTVNSDKWKYYVPQEKMKLRWGKNFDMYYNKIKEAVDDTLGQVIKDDDNLILAAYHAISSGKTEKCSDVFGGELKYLTNVPSPDDVLAPNYLTTSEFSCDKFKNLLFQSCTDCDFGDYPSQWVGNANKTESGMVKEIFICNHKFTGTEIRKIFSLRSADFDIKYDNNRFIFDVRGYGHGVGMSQYGAEYMAKKGADYKKILSWYYPDTYIDIIK